MGDNETPLCWIDLETTGLDANTDVPLEVGLKLTDKEGYVFAEFSTLVHEPTDLYRTAINRGRKHEIVGPMHEKSGLWQDVLFDGVDVKTRAQADAAMCEFLDDNEVPFGSTGLIGNSIGSLDRPFALIHFPKFNLQAGYRNLDVSTLKELCKRHNPTLFENLRPIIGDKSMATHRVLGDIDASIKEYQAYLDNFLICED
jgi:oligoribonuclease